MSKSSSNMFYLGFFLCAVCAVSAAVMGGAALLTKGPIEKAQIRKVSESLRKILPPFDNDPFAESCMVSSVRFYTARKEGKVVGYAGELSVNSGYGGKMEALLSFHPDGRIRSFVVTQHSETPGLGSVVTDRTSPVTLRSLFSRKKSPDVLPPNRILDQYAGHSLQGKDPWRTPWKIAKDGGDVQYVTGATLSSRAVNELAWKGAEAFAGFLASRKTDKTVMPSGGVK